MVNHDKKPDKISEDESIKVPEEEALLPQQIEPVESAKGENNFKLGNGDVKEGKEEWEEKSPVDVPVRRLSEIAEDLYKTGETACGVWCFKGSLLQRFANKKAYVILYGVLGSIMSASYAYLNGTITTLEKRFKIPSTNTGQFNLKGSPRSTEAFFSNTYDKMRVIKQNR